MYEDICAQLGHCLNPTHDHGEGETRLSRLIDTADPAIDHIVDVLANMAGSGVEFTPEIIQAAVKMGRSRHRREELPRKIIPAPRRSTPASSVVYYIRRGNLIKIGTTTSLKRRMAALMPDEILALEPGDTSTESHRHQQFQALQTKPRSEYFYPGAALQRHISDLRQKHGAPPASLPQIRGASQPWGSVLEDGDRLL
ncbi:hypothetical protein ACIRLA_33765 [Streptomyces sp. NPDC102364]|uniref:hypothetical protein n=1 Tax=Streptomyces sp. NPDC102364 TaxID=3366161 RepID=UPI003828CC94